MSKLEIGAHLFFFSLIVIIVTLSAFWSIEMAYRVIALLA